MKAVNTRNIVLLAGVATQAMAVAWAAGPVISSFVGREFQGTTPPGIKWEATSEIIEGGKPLLRLNRGNLDKREVVWVDRIKTTDLKSGAVRVIADIIEAPKLNGKESVVVSCYWADGENRGKQLQGVIAVINPDLQNSSPYLNLPFRVIHAWTADPSTGRLKKLDPSHLDCAPEDED